MNIIDQIFGWLMVALGVAHCVTSFRIQPLSHFAVSLSATGVAIIVSGFLNVTRARHGDGLTRVLSLVANCMILALALGLAWPMRYHLLHAPQMLGMLIATVIELAVAFLG